MEVCQKGYAPAVFSGLHQEVRELGSVVGSVRVEALYIDEADLQLPQRRGAMTGAISTPLAQKLLYICMCPQNGMRGSSTCFSSRLTLRQGLGFACRGSSELAAGKL